MPRLRDPKKKRITAKPYTELGYAEVLNGYWHIRVGPKWQRKSTKIPAVDGNDARVREKLKQAIIRIHGDGKEAQRPRRTINELAAEYEEEALKTASSATLGQFHAAVKHYLDKDALVGFDALRKMIRDKQKVTELAPPSQRCYLIALRGMFDYAIENRELEYNPIFRKLPSSETQYIDPFTEWEAKRILKWFRDRKPHRRGRPSPLREFYLAYRLQSLLGTRIGEIVGKPATNLRYDAQGDLLRTKRQNGIMRLQIRPDCLWIVGKGGRPRRVPLIIPKELERSAAAGDRVAQVRVLWVRKIRAILDELLATPAPADGRLFHIKRAQTLKLMEDAREALGMPTDDLRSSHCVRKFGIWYMREVLRLPRHVRTEISGHSEEIARKHYEKFSVVEQARELLEARPD